MATAAQRRAQERFAALARKHGGRIPKGASTGGSVARKSPTMAKTTKQKGAIRRKASAFNAAASRRGVNIKAMGVGAAVGVITPYATQVAGDWAPGAVMTGAGILGKNEALQTLGAASLAATAVRRLSSGTAFAAPTMGGGLL